MHGLLHNKWGRHCGLAGLIFLSSTVAWASSRPETCLIVSPARTLQSAIDAIPDHGALCLLPGQYSGPAVINKPMALKGPASAVITSGGQGSTIAINADGVQLLGFTIRGSGNRFDLNDSAIKATGKHIRLEGLHIEGALFGLSAEKASDVVFRGNEIAGDLRKTLGLRGDAVRLWETRDSLIEGNRITGCRDIIIWYSSHDRVINNLIYGGRYGTHFMYSDHQDVENNRYFKNTVGVFSMYAHAITIRHNLVEDSSPSDGMGIGIKDSDELTIDGNQLIRDNTGVYLDASPSVPNKRNVFERNLIALNDTAVIFHATETNTEFSDNTFRENQAVTSVEGGGNALQASWKRNFYDDYKGYDLDRNGFGDVAYELRSFSTQLVDTYPALAFFRGSPAMNLIEFFSKVFPYLQPKLILRDTMPRMNAPRVERLAG